MRSRIVYAKSDARGGHSKQSSSSRRRLRRLSLKTAIVLALAFFIYLLSHNLKAKVPLSSTEAVRRSLGLEGTEAPRENTIRRVQDPKGLWNPKIFFSGNVFVPVALLFLCTGRISNEPVWRAFLEAAGRLEFRHPPPDRPYISYVTDTGKEFFNRINSVSRRLLASEDDISCTKEQEYLPDEVERLLAVSSDPRAVVQNQKLFSLYTHPGKSYTFPKDSIFWGTETNARIDTQDSWATFNLVAAEVELLRTALEDTRNQKFMLLSSSCLPFHRPEVIYLQLMAESKSRIDSCSAYTEKVMIHRWDDGLQSEFITKDKWRKSWQWFCLKRSHAEVVATDNHVYTRFMKNCVWKRTVCVPDEHYISTALAVYGLDNETDCIGEVTYMAWQQVSAWHPNTFTIAEIKGGIFETLRNETYCSSKRALRSTDKIFHHRRGPNECSPFGPKEPVRIHPPPDTDDWMIQNGYKPFDYTCKLFARKFGKDTIETTVEAALSCDGIGLGYWC